MDESQETMTFNTSKCVWSERVDSPLGTSITVKYIKVKMVVKISLHKKLNKKRDQKSDKTRAYCGEISIF